MPRYDAVFLHAPSVYDFRKKPIFYGPVSDVIPSSPVFEMYPIGFMTISTHLQRAGYRTRIANIAGEMLADAKFDAERKVAKLDADVYFIDLHWLPHAHGAIEIAKLVKKHHPDAKTEFGGFSSSYFYDELIRRPEVDLVMRGDTTELATVRMMDALSKGEDLSSVPNLVWKDADGRVHENPMSAVADTLDDIVFDYGTMIRGVMRTLDVRGSVPWYGWEKVPLASVFTVRGCSANCAECGGSHSANRRVACRNHPAFRSPEKLAEDVEGISMYLKAPVFVVGDLRQKGMGYAETFLREMRGRGIDNHVVVELFNGANGEYFSLLDRSLEGGYTVQFSPDSYDEGVRFALGKNYTNENIDRTVQAAFANGCRRMDMFFMTGLPQQTVESALASARDAEHLWSLVGRDAGLFIYDSPFAPFVDPGSRAFEEPEKWGYRLRARTLEDHRRLLDSPSWKQVLSYETVWMDRDAIAETSYDAAVLLTEAEVSAGRLSEEDARARNERTETARKLMHEVDSILGIGDPEERESRLWEVKNEGVRLMDSTIADKNDLEWSTGSVWSNVPRIALGILRSAARRGFRLHAATYLHRAGDGRLYGVGHGLPEFPVHEDFHALYGGSARGADPVDERPGAHAGFQNHPPRSDHGLGGEPRRLPLSEAVGDPRLYDALAGHVQEGGRAAAHAGHRVELPLGGFDGKADRGKHPPDDLPVAVSAAGSHGEPRGPLEDHAAVVGHHPHDPCVWYIRSEGGERESCDDAHQEVPVRKHQLLLLEQGGDAPRLHREDQHVAQRGDLGRRAVHRDPVLPDHHLPGLPAGGAGDDLPRRAHSSRYQASDHRAGHPAGADETNLERHVSPPRLRAIRILPMHIRIFNRSLIPNRKTLFKRRISSRETPLYREETSDRRCHLSRPTCRFYS